MNKYVRATPNEGETFKDEDDDTPDAKGDGDDDGNDGDGGGGGGGGDDNNDPSNNNNDNIVAWSIIIFALDEAVDGLDTEYDLVVGSRSSGVPSECDEPVPTNLIQDAVQRIDKDAIRAVTTWTQTEQLVVPTTNQWDPYYVRYQWQSGDKRLMYVHCEYATFVALEVANQNWGLVCGNCMAHPFVHSPDFNYLNSHGSSQDQPLHQDLITPVTVLAKLIHDTILHCSNMEG